MQETCKRTYQAFLKCVVQQNYVSSSDTFTDPTSTCQAQYGQALAGCRGTTWETKDASAYLDVPMPAYAAVMGFSSKWELSGYYVVPKVSGAKIYKINCAVAQKIADRVHKCLLPRVDSTGSDTPIVYGECFKTVVKEHELPVLGYVRAVVP